MLRLTVKLKLKVEEMNQNSLIILSVFFGRWERISYWIYRFKITDREWRYVYDHHILLLLLLHSSKFLKSISFIWYYLSIFFFVYVNMTHLKSLLFCLFIIDLITLCNRRPHRRKPPSRERFNILRHFWEPSFSRAFIFKEYWKWPM